MKTKNYGTPKKTNPNVFKNGEIVDCMLIERSFPPAYVKALEEKNRLIKEECEAMGDTPKFKQPSYKEGGVCWKIAVIRRRITQYADGTYDGEIVWKTEDGVLVSPNYPVTVNFIQMTPVQHKDFKSKTGTLLGDMHKRGGGDKIYKGKPSVADLFPSVNPCKDFKEGVSADKIAPGLEDKFKDLLKQETERKQQWAELVTEYMSEDEESALEYLEDLIARRLLICESDGDTVNYLKLVPGIKFRALIDNYNDGYYFSIKGIGDWDKSAKQFNMVTTMDCKLPSPEELNVVKLIKESIERDKEARSKNENEQIGTVGIDGDF